MSENNRKLPVGIQSFAEIRRGEYLYVDKTEIVWNLTNRGKKYNYLSRPRRFGKSVLVDTLQSYFEGKKELFEGLKIMSLEKEWGCYPVLRFDMSIAGASPESIRSYLDDAFLGYEEVYGLEARADASLAVRFKNIIKTACNKTGQQVVILIDEYDFNAIGCRVEVEKMISTRRIDMVVELLDYVYVMELKLTKNGGLASAERQIKEDHYLEPFKADKRKVVGIAVELDDLGKGLIDWKEVTE